MGIIRPQTETEKDMTPTGSDGNTTGFINLKGPRNTAEHKFNVELRKQEQIATKKGLPFTRHAARAEFEDHYHLEAQKSLRKNGFVKAEEIAPFKLEWAKYSDLKNFKLYETKEVADENLTNRYKVPVYLETKKYKYKGFEKYTYTVMEDGAKALQRALK